MDHHFVPQFLIREWADKDEKVTVFRFIAERERVVTGLSNPRSICMLKDLYKYRSVSEGDPHSLETEFFAKKVDTPAAEALQVMLSGGVGALTSKQREAWSLFLVGLPARTPEAIETKGVEMVLSNIDSIDPSVYEARKRPEDPPKLAEWAQTHASAFIRDKSLEMHIRIQDDPVKIEKMLSANWWLRSFPDHELLLSDRPLLAYPRVAAPNGFALLDQAWRLMLPVGPHTLFCATTEPRWRSHLRKQPPGKIVAGVNEESVIRSQEFVYAGGTRLLPFVEDRILRLLHLRSSEQQAQTQ